jgi:hypothetical protein
VLAVIARQKGLAVAAGKVDGPGVAFERGTTIFLAARIDTDRNLPSDCKRDELTRVRDFAVEKTRSPNRIRTPQQSS